MEYIELPEVKETPSSNIIKIGAYFIIFSLFYSLIIIGTIKYDYYEVGGEAERQLRFSGINDEEQMLNLFMSAIEKKNINILEENVHVYKSEDYAKINVDYQETFSYFGIPIYTFYHEISERKVFLK